MNRGSDATGRREDQLREKEKGKRIEGEADEGKEEGG